MSDGPSLPGRGPSPPRGAPSTLGCMASHRTGPRARPVAALAALAVVLLLLTGAGRASANGDPASDYLTFQNVFFPFSPKVSSGLQLELLKLTNEASDQHYPIRVAIIGSKIDLGAIPQLFGKPQRYARFLYQEISFVYQGQLLIVMPQGLGSVGPVSQDIVKRALAGIRVDPSAGPDGLAQAAIAAVTQIAVEAGHPLGGGGGGATGTILAAVGAAAAIGGAVGFALWRRGRRASARPA
jgi:hypothetical protein